MSEKICLIRKKIVNFLVHLPISVFFSIVYGFPARKLKIIAVTGTEGKTTTVNLIYSFLKRNFPTAMISTVSAQIDKEVIDTGLHVTSPSPRILQKLLRKIVKKGIKYVVLEATSHGLDQFRFWGINFTVGVLTNIHREHFDYHLNQNDYLQAKMKALKNSKVVVLNKDDSCFDYFNNQSLSLGKKVITYAIDNQADFKAENIVFGLSGMSFNILKNNQIYKITSKIIGKYNVYNILASVTAVESMGIGIESLVEEIKNFSSVEGRLEEIKNNLGVKIFVDFAHTPNSLEQVLSTLKKLVPKTGKLVVVFGSAGKRDKGKRPLMGEAAARFADLIILTADDPRDESIRNINRQIAFGCKTLEFTEETNDQILKDEYKRYIFIDDRKKAIDFALKIAKKGDFIVICGKGHEKSLAVGKEEIPWSDKRVVEELLLNEKRRRE